MSINDVIEKARQQASKGIALDEKLNKMMICCGCLGDRSDDVNEIVECDGCGVTVHEGPKNNSFFIFIPSFYIFKIFSVIFCFFLQAVTEFPT